MKYQFSLVIAAFPLALCQCQSDGWCQFASALNQAGHAFAVSKLGPFAGPEPDSNDLYTNCRQGNDGVGEPDYEPAALASRPPAGLCEAPHDVGDPCPACVLSHCCAEMVACVDDYTCTCRLARETPGVSWPEEAKCDAPNEVTDDARACLSAHCAAECLP